MGALPAITAGVSVISSISNLSAKNKAAAAERQAQEEQRTQANASALAQQQQLGAAQQLAQQQYGLSTLARLAASQQADFGAQAQQQMAELKAQQEAYAIDAGTMQQEIGGIQAEAQLAKQRAQIEAASQAQQQQADAKTIATSEALVNAGQQFDASLTQEERRQLALQTSSRMRSTSSDTAQGKGMLERAAAALSIGLDLDRTAVLAELQNMGETTLAQIGEQLGLNDNQLSAENVAANLKMMRLSSANAKSANAANLVTDTAGIQFARDANALNSQLDQAGAKRSYDAALKGYATQGELNSVTNKSVNRQIDYAQRNTKGAGIFDYINAGVQAYGAVTPLLGGAPKPKAPVKYSGFPTAFQDVG